MMRWFRKSPPFLGNVHAQDLDLGLVARSRYVEVDPQGARLGESDFDLVDIARNSRGPRIERFRRDSDPTRRLHAKIAEAAVHVGGHRRCPPEPQFAERLPLLAAANVESHRADGEHQSVGDRSTLVVEDAPGHGARGSELEIDLDLAYISIRHRVEEHLGKVSVDDDTARKREHASLERAVAVVGDRRSIRVTRPLHVIAGANAGLDRDRLRDLLARFGVDDRALDERRAAPRDVAARWVVRSRPTKRVESSPSPGQIVELSSYLGSNESCGNPS